MPCLMTVNNAPEETRQGGSGREAGLRRSHLKDIWKQQSELHELSGGECSEQKNQKTNKQAKT